MPAPEAPRSRRRSCSTAATSPCARWATARCGWRWNHFRPDPDFRVGPDLARAVVLEWRVPAGATPGVYTGSAVFTAGGVRLSVPLRVRVFAVDLPPVPIPVGLFMSALPFGPEVLGEGPLLGSSRRRSSTSRARAGLTCVSGGVGLDFAVTRGAGGLALSVDRALRYLEMARARGMCRAAVTYGGFLQLRSLGVDARAFAAVRPVRGRPRPAALLLLALRRAGYQRRDELKTAIAAVRPFTEAGLQTMGPHPSEQGRRPL